MTTIFFYGSLRDRELTEVVLGRTLASGELSPARAPGYATRRLGHEAYPMLITREGTVAEGVVLRRASASDLERLTFFEEAEYGLAPITVETPDGPTDAQYFLASDKLPKTDEPWDFERWWREERDIALEAARELMEHFGRTAVADIDTVWPGIMNRARQRVGARDETPRLGGLRTAFDPGAVEVAEQQRTYSAYLGVEEYRLRHRRFDGGWTAPLARTAVLWGDAVTVLPYDPRTDRLVLIEQFRVAAHARGDRCPWCIEVVAGRLDAAGTPGEAARRESLEETGVRLGRLVEIGRYYSTPGLAAEVLTGFVGEADLAAAAGGVHGLADEGEDIRAIVLDFEAAMAEVAAGSVNTGPALLSLLWLAANRERLRAEWAEGSEG